MIDASRHLAILDSRGVSLARLYVLLTVEQSPKPLDRVARIASSCSDGDPRGSSAELECAQELEACLEAGVLQVVTSKSLAQIRALLASRPGTGPLYRRPVRGDVDFTVAGARSFKSLHRQLYGDFGLWCLRGKGRRERLFAPTRACAKRAITYQQTFSGLIAAGLLTRIGPWYAQWWRYYSHGWTCELRFGARTN